MSATRPRQILAGLAAALLLVACSNSNKSEPPAELTDFRSSARVTRAWTAGVDAGNARLRLGLGVATDGERVFAAGNDGDVVALDGRSGKRLWLTDTRLRLTGGPGVGGGLVVAGASHGGVVALDAATGRQKWRAQIKSEILSAPAVSGDMVLVRAVDGSVVALRATDGSQLWIVEQQVPRLSLRGTATPLIVGDVGICGFDNGRLMAVSLKDGSTLWDVTVSPPSGRTELERLIDIDSAVIAVGNDVYAVTFQGKVARVDLETGQLQWSRDMSSYTGLATDEDGLYVTSATGVVTKIGRRTGIELWKQEVLGNRRLSPPAVLGQLVAVADLDGYVHFLDAANGELAARLRPLGERVSARPVVVGDLLVLMDVDGDIVALRAAAAAAKG